MGNNLYLEIRFEKVVLLYLYLYLTHLGVDRNYSIFLLSLLSKSDYYTGISEMYLILKPEYSIEKYLNSIAFIQLSDTLFL